MTKEAAEFIKTAYDTIGDYEVEIQEYSGRGMFGTTTHALTMDRMAFNDILSIVVQYIKDDINFNGGDGKEFINSIPDFSGFRTDSMGMGIVVY